MRFGLSYKVGKRGRVYVPVSGKKGGGLLSSLGSILLLGIGLGIVKYIIDFIKQHPQSVLIALTAIVAAAISAVMIIKKRKQEQAAKTDTISFTLKPDTSEDYQSMLREFNLTATSEGYNGTLSLRNNDDGKGFFVRSGDLFFGYLDTLANAWVNENFENIETISDFQICGGGVDVDGNPRPFIPKITLALKKPIQPPELEAYELPACKRYSQWNGLASNAIVYVSSSNKAHMAGMCGVNLNRCKAMYLTDAVEAGCEPCLNCFR